MRRSSPKVALILIALLDFASISCANDAKESILEKPPAEGTSRLPWSAQNFAVNSTNTREEATTATTATKATKATDKNIGESIKEVREPPEFEEPPAKPSHVRSANSSYEPFAKPSNENYIAVGNHKFVESSRENYETGFTPFVPSPQFSEETKSSDFHPEGDAAFKANRFKSSAEVKHEHFYSPSLSDYYGGTTRNNLINLPYSKFHRENIPHVTTFASPTVKPMQRPNLHYDDKNYPVYVHPPSPSPPPPLTLHHHHQQQHQQHQHHQHHHHIDEYGKTNDFTGPHFHRGKFPVDFHAHNDFLGHGAAVDDGFFHNYPKPVHSGKPHPKSYGLWRILATLLPIGLFLSALQPKVIFINSTNPQPPNGVKPFFRYADENGQTIDANVVLYNLVANAGFAPSNDVTCNKMKICQAALGGSESNDETNFAEYSLWYLVSRSTSSIRKKLHLDDVFDAVQSRQCEQFSCSVQQETTTTQKNQT